MIYNAAVVKEVVQKDAKTLDAFCATVEAMDKFLNVVARHGYQSKQAEESFKAMAGNFGTMEAMVTNYGYKRAQKATKKQAKR